MLIFITELRVQGRSVIVELSTRFVLTRRRWESEPSSSLPWL
jgi:hypothetical protein